jgi:hypothetical protein
MPDARSDVELRNDRQLYGICMFCATPRMTNRDGRANVEKQALICPNDDCPAMQAIIVSPPD